MSTHLQSRLRKCGESVVHWLAFALSLLTIGWVTFIRQEDEMTGYEKLVSAFLKNLRRGRRIFAGIFALALLIPTSAFAMDSAPKGTFGRDSDLSPLPSIPYLDSMRWMDCKPGAPVFKVDTLLLPDSTQPGVFRLPSDYERDLPRVS